jgi:hypothetical protein
MTIVESNIPPWTVRVHDDGDVDVLDREMKTMLIRSRERVELDEVLEVEIKSAIAVWLEHLHVD